MVQVRPARLDRPLRGASLGPTYTDPHLEELVERAAERAREEARAEGYASGWAQGRQAAAEREREERTRVERQATADREALAKRYQELLATLREAVQRADVAAAPEWAEVADALAEGALQLAAAALGRELRSVDGAVLESVKAALRQLTEPGDAVVHLNPADLEQLPETAVPGVRVVADPRVTVGSLLCETPSQRFRHDLPGALAAAEEVLRS